MPTKIGDGGCGGCGGGGGGQPIAVYRDPLQIILDLSYHTFFIVIYWALTKFGSNKHDITQGSVIRNEK